MNIARTKKKKKILVTGGTGFIGKALVEDLVKSGHEISVLVRKSSKVDPLKALGVCLIYADVAVKESLNKILDYKFDLIFHCAALVENKSLESLRKVNVTGTENICNLALNLGVERLIYLSSVSVVSGNNDLLLREDLPYSATNAYGLSKIEAEKIALDYRKKGLKVAVLRPCTVYGEGEPHLFGPLLFLLKNRLLPLISDGNHKLHLVYVRNVVNALMLALEKEEFLSGTFFVADTEILTINEIFLFLCKAIGGPLPCNLPSWINPILFLLPYDGNKLKFFFRDRVFDISKIKALGYQPAFKVEESLLKTAQYWLKEVPRKKERGH